MDPASRALAMKLPPGVKDTLANRAKHGKVKLSTLYHRKAGRRSKEAKNAEQQWLTPPEEKALIRFLLHMSDLGQPVRIKHIDSLAFSIARNRPPSKRPLEPPGKNWSREFEKRNPVLKARKVSALDWERHPVNIYDKIIHWFEVIGQAFRDYADEIRGEDVYNMDETGVMLSKLGSVKVLIGRNDLRKYRGARVKRTVVTSIECISGDGRYLDPMVIWPASTHRATWTTHPTPGWFYACSESGYTDSFISLEWLKRVFDPQTKERANGRPRWLIQDGFGTHETLDILEFCLDNNIIPCRLPSHTSHKLQPCDVAVFGPLKSAYRDECERLERGGVGTIGKSHFTCLYAPARVRAFTKKNILSGWAKSGLFPFNPNRVLKDTPKPITTSQVPRLQRVLDPRLDDDQVQTPTTPLTSDAVISLQNLINQDAHALDETTRWRLQRHLQKLANAANTSIAEGSLQKEQIQFLYKVNNEAKVRRSTKPVVLSNAKVISHKDLEEARAKRAEKDAKKKAKKAERDAKKVEREAKEVEKEAEKEAKKAEREAKKAEREAKKAEREAKKAEREAQKAAKEAEKAATGKRTRGRKRKLPATSAPEPEAKRSRKTKERELPWDLTIWVDEGQVAPVAKMI